ncbi:cation:proton antiporter [Myxosarcina sp. GI1]|uniref:cation:proton antiporter domain-containing protein n=1 Tax=Myxosarcina sp. GI1 TaxID=1541065 RepID=UPI00056BE571|nr:cation:proton antiporter [Myxosarcina sp. GI1]
MESFSEAIREPIVTFALLLAIILLIPPVFEKLRLPGLVGLLVAGVVFGSSGLGFLNSKSESMVLLSDIGKIYLMFVAGLEIDLEQFRQTRNRSLGFGMATFAIPLIAGTLVGRCFGFEWNTSVLIGSLLASHTLLAFPIVQRLGVVKDEAVTVTIGATIFTDIGALLVLAVCVGVNEGDFTALDFARLFLSLIIYAAIVLFGLDSLGKMFFSRTKQGGNQFLFVLLALFVSSVAAELIGIEPIVGAFLAGLAVNDVIGDGPVKEKTEFFGSVLFIPIFFVQMGLLLDLQAFQDIFRSIGIPLSILAALIISKFLAAFFAKTIYRYSWQQAITMWSLSLPQVAATLAAALVAFQAQIINERVFNSVILLMLVTAVAGPLITTRAAEKLTFTSASDSDSKSKATNWSNEIEPVRVVVPVYNPETERYLLELASLLAKEEGGKIFPLAIAKAQARLDSPQLDKAVERSQTLLTQASEIGKELSIAVKPELRIGYDVAQSISHTSREVNANLILLGFSTGNMFQSRLFGSITDSVLWSAHCSVAIARLLDSPLKIQRILVPIENMSPEGLRPLRFAQNIAATPGKEITLLHVCSSGTSKERKAMLHERLQKLATRFSPETTVDVKVTAQSYYVMAILNASKNQELVILRSQRRRIGADGLALSATTKPLLQGLNCSVILLGEP